jgi:hypothetical protein
MARPKRFELLTPRFVVWCSIQLSYGRDARCLRNEPLKRLPTRAIAIGSAAYWQAFGPARAVQFETKSPARADDL